MNELLKKNKLGISTALLIGVLVGLCSGYVFFHNIGESSCVSDLKLIKRNIKCNIYDDKTQTLSVLQSKLEVLISGFQKTGKAKRVGIFVRDLRTSRFAGVNDGDVYYMASLLKTPLIIGGYKLAEVEPRILDQEIYYNGQPNLYNEQVIKSDEMLEVGKSYSIKELMRRSVVYSDNTAAQLLYDFYPLDFMDRIMQALGIQFPKSNDEKENPTTPRLYANVFRSLYNASYLTTEYSNEALMMLTKTTFNKGATAKLPKDILVAHKFAERTVIDPANPYKTTKQLHECGIVYAENSKEPYSFCIMTEGGDYGQLEEVISDISLVIYQEMIKN